MLQNCQQSHHFPAEPSKKIDSYEIVATLLTNQYGLSEN